MNAEAPMVQGLCSFSCSSLLWNWDDSASQRRLVMVAGSARVDTEPGSQTEYQLILTMLVVDIV